MKKYEREEIQRHIKNVDLSMNAAFVSTQTKNAMIQLGSIDAILDAHEESGLELERFLSTMCRGIGGGAAKEIVRFVQICFPGEFSSYNEASKSNFVNGRSNTALAEIYCRDICESIISSHIHKTAPLYDMIGIGCVSEIIRTIERSKQYMDGRDCKKEEYVNQILNSINRK